MGGVNQSLTRNKCKSYNLIYIYLWADFDFYPSSNASLLFSLNCLYLHIFKSFNVGIKLLPPSRGLTCPKNIFLKGNFVYWGTVHKIVFALNVLTYFSSKSFSQSSLAVFQSFSLKFPRLKYPLQQSQNHRQIPDFIDSENTITFQDLDDDFVTIEVDSLILGFQVETLTRWTTSHIRHAETNSFLKNGF